jgi:hypothetical protein
MGQLLALKEWELREERGPKKMGWVKLQELSLRL